MSNSKHYGLLSISHHEATIWTLGGSDEHVNQDLKPYDPTHEKWHLHKKHQHKGGQYAAEDHHYFEEIVKTIRTYDRVILADHGKGKSNEGMVFEKYLNQHHKDLKNLIIMDMDNSNITEPQLLAKADAIVLLHHNKK